MALRSRYRDRLAADNSAERIPESNIQPEIKEDENRVPPSEQIHIELADSGPVTEALQKAVEADEAAERLRQQIDHLHRSKEW